MKDLLFCLKFYLEDKLLASIENSLDLKNGDFVVFFSNQNVAPKVTISFVGVKELFHHLLVLQDFFLLSITE